MRKPSQNLQKRKGEKKKKKKKGRKITTFDCTVLYIEAGSVEVLK